MATVAEGQDAAVVNALVCEGLPGSVLVSVRSALKKNPRLEWRIPATLCAAMLVELLLAGGQLSQTADEATHLYSGYRGLKCGDLTVGPEHPPLAKIVAAAPLVALNFKVDCSPFAGDNLQQATTALNWFYS